MRIPKIQRDGRPRVNHHHTAVANPETVLRLRRNLHGRWIWELLDADRHVVNVSSRDFPTKSQCESDANQSDVQSDARTDKPTRRSRKMATPT
jgi:hypothetical protein